MKFIITSILLFVSIFSYSQKTKRFSVVETIAATITGIISYNEEDVPMDTVFYLTGRDGRYERISSTILFQKGYPEDIIGLLNKCIEAFDEDAGTALTYGDSKIFIEKSAGVKYITLYGIGKDDNGYSKINRSQFVKLKDKFEEYLRSKH
jgi:hypothetical protein